MRTTITVASADILWELYPDNDVGRLVEVLLPANLVSQPFAYIQTQLT
jgi:hypothetical protein